MIKCDNELIKNGLHLLEDKDYTNALEMNLSELIFGGKTFE